MKTLILSLLLTSIGASAGSRGPLYERSVSVADLMYLHERALSDNQKNEITALFDQIEEVLRNDETRDCLDRNQVFQTSYRWAYTSPGPSLTSQHAQNLAEILSSKSCPAKFFEVYRETYEWANRAPGPNKTSQASMETAMTVANYEEKAGFRTRAIECIKDQYEFASSSDGLNKTSQQAERFAYERCLDQN